MITFDLCILSLRCYYYFPWTGVGIEPQRRGNTVFIEHMLYTRCHGWDLTNGISFNLQHNLGGCHSKSCFTDEVMTHPGLLSCEMDQTRFNPTVTWLPGQCSSCCIAVTCSSYTSLHAFPKSHNQKDFPPIPAVLLKVEDLDLVRWSLFSEKQVDLKERNWTVWLRDDRELREVRSPMGKELWFLL